MPFPFGKVSPQVADEIYNFAKRIAMRCVKWFGFRLPSLEDETSGPCRGPSFLVLTRKEAKKQPRTFRMVLGLPKRPNGEAYIGEARMQWQSRFPIWKPLEGYFETKSPDGAGKWVCCPEDV